MAKVDHTSDARVLVGIRCPAAYACMRERGHFQIPARGADCRPGQGASQAPDDHQQHG